MTTTTHKLSCRICRKKFTVGEITEDPRSEPDKAVRHKYFGYTCACHSGVAEIYEIVTKSEKDKIQN